MAGVKGLETRRPDDRAHVQGELLVLLAVVDGVGRADLGADPAVAGEELHAVSAVNNRLFGDRLGVGLVDVAPGVEAGVKLRELRDGGLAADLAEILKMPGGTDKGAGPASAANVRNLSEGGGYLAFGPPARQADGPHVLHLMAHAHAFAAQDAVAFAPGEGRL